jgi:hypothetical protein
VVVIRCWVKIHPAIPGWAIGFQSFIKPPLTASASLIPCPAFLSLLSGSVAKR